MADLNKILDYNLINKKPTISAAAQAKIIANPPAINTDWERGFYDDFKIETKIYYAFKQSRRCGYCRMTINPGGYSNAIEHITPRILKPTWMFVQHNLLITCDGCNSGKGKSNILARGANTYGNNENNCPDQTNEYFIFNPHFEKWSDHFEIVDRVFLKAKAGTKGPATYAFCKMNRYHILIDFLFQLNIREEISHRMVLQRLRKEKNNEKLTVLKEALDHIKEMIENS